MQIASAGYAVLAMTQVGNVEGCLRLPCFARNDVARKINCRCDQNKSNQCYLKTPVIARNEVTKQSVAAIKKYLKDKYR